MRRTLVAAVLVMAGGSTLAGCSSTVAQSDVEEQISTQLEAEVGEEPDDISCPGDLDAEVGTTMTCTLTEGGDELDVAVEVTEVDGGEVSFDIEVEGPAA